VRVGEVAGAVHVGDSGDGIWHIVALILNGQVTATDTATVIFVCRCLTYQR
jgi:hypothetical protein